MQRGRIEPQSPSLCKILPIGQQNICTVQDLSGYTPWPSPLGLFLLYSEELSGKEDIQHSSKG